MGKGNYKYLTERPEFQSKYLGFHRLTCLPTGSEQNYRCAAIDGLISNMLIIYLNIANMSGIKIAASLATTKIISKFLICKIKVIFGLDDLSLLFCPVKNYF
jgi:hypothetical protein